MRIGLISDVHGDHDALSTVLERFDTVHQVDQILCAGDLVGRGPQQDRVVEIIRQRKIVTVLGNHDELLPELSFENEEFLKSLPLDWRGKVGNCQIFMCHGKPGNNMWGMYRDHLSNTYVNMVLKSLKVSVLVTGHTHVPLYMHVKRGCIVNPGSLYTFENPRESSGTYGVLDLPEMSFEVFEVGGTSPTRVDLEYSKSNG